jgi:hypothetical protein
MDGAARMGGGSSTSSRVDLQPRPYAPSRRREARPTARFRDKAAGGFTRCSTDGPPTYAHCRETLAGSPDIARSQSSATRTAAPDEVVAIAVACARRLGARRDDEGHCEQGLR